MRMGWQWKTAATGIIFNSLFKLRGINTVGTGKLVNLISNDVSRFEEFAVMAPFAIISMFELAAILVILIFQLNIASAFAGIGMTILFIPIQVYLAKQFAKRRTNTAHQTDLRVRYTSELIDGIATVKSYAWENPFFTLLSELRRLETACIKQSQTLRSVNQGLFYCIPWVAAFATFSVFWASGKNFTRIVVKISSYQSLTADRSDDITLNALRNYFVLILLFLYYDNRSFAHLNLLLSK